MTNNEKAYRLISERGPLSIPELMDSGMSYRAASGLADERLAFRGGKWSLKAENNTRATAPVETVKVGDTIVIRGVEHVVNEVQDHGLATHLLFDDVAAWGPCVGRFAAENGTPVEVVTR